MEHDRGDRIGITYIGFVLHKKFVNGEQEFSLFKAKGKMAMELFGVIIFRLFAEPNIR